MIQFKRGKYNLDKLLSYTEYGNSKIFQVSLPEELCLGRNEIKVKVNSNILLKGTDVYIDILDFEKNPIFYKISSIANEDLTRTIVVYIYENTPKGQATIYMSGTLQDESTYLFSTNINVSGNVNKQPIKFENKPIVTYKERLELVRSFESKRQVINLSGSATSTVSLVSRSIPKNIDRDTLNIERVELSNTTKNNQITNDVGTTVFSEIPTYFENSILTAKNFTFSSSMKGGTIYVNNLTLPNPNEATSSSPFSNISFSASIIDVINTSSIEIFPPFRKTIEYQTKNNVTSKISFDRFFNHSNFTASYYEYVTLSSSLTTQSYAHLDLYDIEPEVGNLKNIKVSYKPLNVFGNSFQPLGSFNIGKVNLLSDSGSVYFDNELGLIERPTGYFRNGKTDFHRFWTTQSFGTGSILVSNSSLIENGVRISYTTTRSISEKDLVDNQIKFVLVKSATGSFCHRNTELELTFDSFVETDYSHSIGQLDVYISGSDISTNDELNSVDQRLMVSSSLLGNYLGTITGKFGKLQKNSFNFISKESKPISPVFVIQSGVWNFGNIELNTRNQKGFSPNQSRVYVPLNNVQSKTELSLLVEYENEDGVVGNWSTTLDKIYYKGLDDTKQELLLTYDSSSVHTFIQNEAAEAIPTQQNPIQFSFQVFQDKFGNNYTGSIHNVGMIIDINTVVFGYTGSISGSRNSYVWSITSQVRGAVTSFDNFGQPILFDPIHISGSSVFSLGTYGPGGSTTYGKANLDSWITVGSLQSDVGRIIIAYRLVPTGSSSGPWYIHATSVCKVQKYEIKYR